MEQYIPKSALVAEINQRVEDYKSHKIDDSYHDGLIFALEDLRDDFIDTLEVKEVDLEKEIKEEYIKCRCYGGRNNMLVILNELHFNKLAKYFFELGIAVNNKAQKKRIV